MTDAAALLQSILSDPADDLPRLLYADHLDERGEGKRAEFVRVQVELERPIGQSFVDVEEILELRRRDRELTPDVQDCEWCPIVTEIWQRNESEWRGLHTIATWQRGFISTIRLSWADWLRHHEAMYWHPKQTVECPECEGRGFLILNYMRSACVACGGHEASIEVENANLCSIIVPSKDGTGRIPRPFVATAQPITRVELTTWPCEPMTGINASAIGAREHTFNRVKCSACDGEPYYVPEPRERRVTDWITTRPIELMMVREECPKCHGQPLNEWHCDQWPTITFAMPDSR